MTAPLRFGPALDAVAFAEIRREMEIACFKWDAQVGDVSTLVPSPLVVGRATWHELARLAEALARETTAMETELLARPDLHRALGVPRALRAILRARPPTPAIARVMRFDFHWTTEGWKISEVNSDVPGGYTEAASFAALLARGGTGASPAGDPAGMLADAIARRLDAGATVALVVAAGHMEDQQVVSYVGARLRARGLETRIVHPAQLADGGVAAVFRFYQAEWLPRLPRAVAWQTLLVGGTTPVVNPASAILGESKRLPLVWDRLEARAPTWRRLLPETRALAEAPWSTSDRWLIKSAYSNTGDTVSIRSAMSASAWRWRAWSARLDPSSWIAQRRFETVPLVTEGKRLSPCVGVYVVDGVAAGAYARASEGPIVDAFARDVALLVEDRP